MTGAAAGLGCKAFSVNGIDPDTEFPAGKVKVQEPMFPEAVYAPIGELTHQLELVLAVGEKISEAAVVIVSVVGVALAGTL